jgi:hypothetical protein
MRQPASLKAAHSDIDRTRRGRSVDGRAGAMGRNLCDQLLSLRAPLRSQPFLILIARIAVTVRLSEPAA